VNSSFQEFLNSAGTLYLLMLIAFLLLMNLFYKSDSRKALTH
jgi:hypothetical protein